MRTLLPHAELRDVTLRPAAMAKVWLGPGQTHETIAVPGVALARGDVLVATELSTICGCARRVWAGGRSVSAPLVLGHESVGRVIALGEDGARGVDGGELRVGDRVIWSTSVSCGDCDRCAAGLRQKCRTLVVYGREKIEPRWELTGAFATHVHLRAGTGIVRVPEALPSAVLAPTACATATAWSAVARAGTGRAIEGAQAIVFGAGMIGLTAAAIASDAGATVTVVDASAKRRELAERFGAHAVADSRGLAEADMVLDTVGGALAPALAAVAVGGVIVLLGAETAGDAAAEGSSPGVSLDAERMAERMVTIAGVDGSTWEELAAAAGFLAGRGRAFPFAELVGELHPLVDIDVAFAGAQHAIAPRTGIVPR